VQGIGGLPTLQGDPTHTITHDPSTYFTVDFGFNYDIINLDLALGLYFSSSMELVQNDVELSDGAKASTITNNLYAQSTTQITASLSISNPFPFGPNPLLNESFNIISPTPAAPPPTNAATIQFDYYNGQPIYHYETTRTGIANTATAESTCLAAPAVNNDPVSPSSPQTLVQQVGNAAQQNLFPCNVKLCNPSSENSPDGTLRTCNWNTTTQSLQCTQTSTACSVCQDSADLCDASGHVYAPSMVVNHDSWCTNQ
jgi:hypothetical protein